MLKDHKLAQERRAHLLNRRKELPKAFGTFIASLALWDWFINPFTFRDAGTDGTQRPQSTPERTEKGTRLQSDPRITSWRPSSRWARPAGPPAPDWAMKAIRQYLVDLEGAANRPIGWVIAEEFGRLGGRHHCHGLVTGVGHLRRDYWWEEAFKRFGRTKIMPFNPEQAAAFYTAKYAAKQLGGLHFGGTLAGVDLVQIENRVPRTGGGIEIVKSADLPRDFYHMTLGRKHR